MLFEHPSLLVGKGGTVLYEPTSQLAGEGGTVQFEHPFEAR